MEMIFDIQFQLMKEIHISVAQNRLGIMGPSGCGKSTLLRTLAGLHPANGYFKFKNKNMSDVPVWERSFGYLPQDTLLFPHLNVKDNILYPKNSKLDEQILNGLQIENLLDRMPRNLSGGEKQRVGLARALSASPELLLLDEPFSSLDSKTKAHVISFLNACNTPMIIISHGEDELKALNSFILSLEN